MRNFDDADRRFRFRRSVWLGVAAALLLLGFYLTVVGLMNRSFLTGLRDLGRWWYWFLPLGVGFGLQVGILGYLRLCQAVHRPAGGVAVSTGTSSGAMLACCLHHVADVLPLLGLSAVATFLSRYQQPLFALALVANVVGVGILFRRLRQMTTAERAIV